MLRRISITLTTIALCLPAAACTGDDTADDDVAEETEGDGDPGDGDGDPTTTGDGDGDPTTTGDGDPTTTGDGDPTTTGDGDDGDPQPCSGELLPQDEFELIAWLEGGGYTDWAAESGIHDSTGPHFGDVRAFVDSCLFDSLDAAATEHPPGSASVKELYGGGDQILGWAVMLKVEPGAGGDTWYWFEVYNGTVYADGTGAGLCTGCHGGGVDFFLSPWPLQ